MLNELHIENIAVIERADISFGRGLNILTGETGAGLSAAGRKRASLPRPLMWKAVSSGFR